MNGNARARACVSPAQRCNCFSTVIIVFHFKGVCFDSFWNFNLKKEFVPLNQKRQ